MCRGPFASQRCRHDIATSLLTQQHAFGPKPQTLQALKKTNWEKWTSPVLRGSVCRCRKQPGPVLSNTLIPGVTSRGAFTVKSRFQASESTFLVRTFLLPSTMRLTACAASALRQTVYSFGFRSSGCARWSEICSIGARAIGIGSWE